MTKFFILLAISAFMVKIDCRKVYNTKVVEIVVDEEVDVQNQGQGRPSCQKNNLVSVAQWFHPPTGCYFFTAAQDETVLMGKIGAGAAGWNYQNCPGRGSTNSRDCKGNEKGYKAVHRVWNANTVDWLVTANKDEVTNALSSEGYVYYTGLPWKHVGFYGSEVAGHCGATVSLYRCTLNKKNTYSTSLDDINACVAKGGKDQGVMIYLWPAEESLQQ